MENIPKYGHLGTGDCDIQETFNNLCGCGCVCVFSGTYNAVCKESNTIFVILKKRKLNIEGLESVNSQSGENGLDFFFF